MSLENQTSLQDSEQSIGLNSVELAGPDFAPANAVEVEQVSVEPEELGETERQDNESLKEKTIDFYHKLKERMAGAYIGAKAGVGFVATAGMTREVLTHPDATTQEAMIRVLGLVASAVLFGDGVKDGIKAYNEEEAELQRKRNASSSVESTLDT